MYNYVKVFRVSLFTKCHLNDNNNNNDGKKKNTNTDANNDIS